MANENSVKLEGYYGGDITHACSAWTSTSRELTPEKIARIPALLKQLAQNNPPHKTPFEKSTLHFIVTTDIASHIHLIKHRVGVSVNAESARYKELKEDNFLLPSDWQAIPDYDVLMNVAYHCNMDSSTSFNDPFYGSMGEVRPITWADILKWYTELGNKLYHASLNDLTKELGRKRAKESARYFKGYNSQITADVMFNFSSFAHFLNLRNKPEAQLEIREIAAKMLELVKNIDGNPFEHTILAFNL
jgi:flavin-dependent thymidylate synthase